MVKVLKTHHITEKLIAYDQGDPDALGEVVSLIYEELHQRAKLYFNSERKNHTLQPTALINEAYLRLIEQRSGFRNRTHFLAMASTVMRWVLVNHANSRDRQKRGGKNEDLSLDEALQITVDNSDVNVLELHELLDRLSELDEQQANIVQLKFFGGLTIDEMAEVLQIAPATVKRDWVMAKSWLYSQLNKKG